MVTAIIIGAVLLVLLILVLVFRIHTLLGVMRGTNDRPVGTGLSNTVNAWLLFITYPIGLIGFYWSYMNARPYFLPESSSVHGVATDRLFWVTMTILLIAFVVTNVLLYTFPLMYRYRADRKAYFYPDNHKLEIIWTIIPALVMAGIVAYGLYEWKFITTFPPEEECEVIEIMGRQFDWQVRYPGADKKFGKYDFRKISDKDQNIFGLDFADSAAYDDFTATELHFPKGKKIWLKIRARDVIHSVFLPHFRVKMDAVPGMPTKFWFIPTKSTQEMRDKMGQNFDYKLVCTEICGKGHYAMALKVVVDEPEDYEKWKAEQKALVKNMKPAYVRTMNPKYSDASEAPAAPSADPNATEIKDTVDVEREIKAKGSVALHIKFEVGKADLDASANEAVDKVFAVMKANPDLKFEIQGHTDSTGDAKKNKVLSQQRAQAIVDALIKKGIEKKRLTAKGYGSDKPVESNATPRGQAMNRRVEIVKK